MKRHLILLAILLGSICACKPTTENEQSKEQVEEQTATPSTSQEGEKINEHTEDTYLVKENAFLGIKPGDEIKGLKTRVEKAVLSSGEGDFEAYHILSENGEKVGYFYPGYQNPELVGQIMVTTKSAQTQEGLKIGMSFKEIKSLINNFEVHGSEIESRTYLYHGNLVFRLDHASTAPKLDIASVPDDTRILEIQIQEPYKEPSEENGYYICYKADDKPALQFVVHYDNSGDAKTVRYKGQTEKMDLKFVERAIVEEGQAAYVLKYDEMYEGKVNGRYEFTHSGNWDYAKYIRQDGKVYNFTFMADKSYQETPCF